MAITLHPIPVRPIRARAALRLCAFLIAGAAMASAGMLILASGLEFERARALADSLTFDGSFNGFTPEFHRSLVLKMRVAAAIAIAF